MKPPAQSYSHRGGSVPLLGATIPEHLAGVIERFPDREAVVGLPQGRRLGYGQLGEEADRLASGLLALGCRPGDRVGIWSTNNIEWLLLQIATARIGALLVTINPGYRIGELAHALGRAKAQVIFTIPSFRSSNYVAMLAELVPELERCQPDRLQSAALPDLRRVVLYDPVHPGQTARPFPGFSTWQELLEAGAEIRGAQLEQTTAGLDRDQPINVQYTSGTTGLPKAVSLSHHNLLNNAYFTARAMHFSELDRLAVPVPFYHCFGMVLGNLLCLSVGACIVIPCEHFAPLPVLEAVASEGCTAIHGVPTMFISELAEPRFEEFDVSSLRTGVMAGAPCPPELIRRVMEQMHCREILIGYGQTEASPLTHLTSPEDSVEQRCETVGRNLPHQEAKVVDPETGRTLPLGAVGEVCFRGYHVMRGYYGDARATAEAIDEQGWLHSGDLGSMDTRGYLRVTGRLKEMIIRGGENIYPSELEDLLFTHPGVAEVAVFGVPDEFYGEEVMAWVRLHPGEAVSQEELRLYCEERVAHFKVPRYVRFVEEFPMTVTGKPQKFRMREMALQEITQGESPAGPRSAGPAK